MTHDASCVCLSKLHGPRQCCATNILMVNIRIWNDRKYHLDFKDHPLFNILITETYYLEGEFERVIGDNEVQPRIEPCPPPHVLSCVDQSINQSINQLSFVNSDHQCWEFSRIWGTLCWKLLHQGLEGLYLCLKKIWVFKLFKGKVQKKK